MMPEPEYGHAYCTCCAVEIDLSTQPRYFSGTSEVFASGHELLIFFMCDLCADEYQASSSEMRLEIAKQAIAHLTDVKHRYAIVTLSALIVNYYNLVSAYEKGVKLPRTIIEQFQRGEISDCELYTLAKLQEFDGLMGGHYGHA